MFFDETWTPGVYIGERRSDDPAACASFGAFAHRIHRDLLAARSEGRIPEHVEVTTAAAEFKQFYMVDVRLDGLYEPQHTAVRRELVPVVRNIADPQLSDGLDWARFPWGLAGAVFFVDGDGQLIDYLAQHEA